MRLLPELYQPMKIGPMTVNNRLMMAGMSAGTMFDDDGVAPEMIAYYVERAQGEPGMIAIGANQVIPPAKGETFKHGFGLFSDTIIRQLSLLTPELPKPEVAAELPAAH